MGYYSVKISHGRQEFYYKRRYRKHNHQAQQEFVVAALGHALTAINQALAAINVEGVTQNDLIISQVRQGENDPGGNYIAI